jgi:hypothetical protein
MPLPPSIRRAVRPLATALVVGAAVAFIGLRLREQWAELAAHHWRVQPGWLVVSLAVVSSWFVLRARLWQQLVKHFGGALPYREAFRVWAVSELGRYVPGKVLYVVARPALAARAGVRASVALASMATELALVMMSSAFFFVLPLWTNAALRARYGLLAGVVLLGLAVLIHPRVLGPLLNWGLRRLGRDEMHVRLRGGEFLRLLGLCLALWAGMGLAFFLFARSLWPGLSWQALPLVAGAYALAWTLGLATLVSPGGLGVREAILLALLGPVLPPSGAVVVALASRVWITIAELACAGVAALLRKTAAKDSRDQNL